MRFACFQFFYLFCLYIFLHIRGFRVGKRGKITFYFISSAVLTLKTRVGYYIAYNANFAA